MIKTSQPKSELLIRKTAGVCGGEACIRNTRIPVWVLVSLKRQGIQNSDLLRNYPDLNLDDLAAAWSYQSHNSDEIDATIRANEED